MVRQYTDWGYVDWLEMPDKNNSSQMTAGIVTIEPHGHMSSHIHFNAQVIYTLQGTGYSLIDGYRIDMSVQENRLLNWKPGVVHEMFNTGDDPFVHLMATAPDSIVQGQPVEDLAQAEGLTAEKASEYLYLAVAGIRAQLLDNLNYPVMIFDSGEKLAYKSEVFPPFCLRYCSEEIRRGCARCMSPGNMTEYLQGAAEKCPMGLTVLYKVVSFQGSRIGVLKGGFFHTDSAAAGLGDEDIYITPESSIESAKLLLDQIAKSMVSFCEFYHFRQELMERDLELVTKKNQAEMLLSNLKEAENSLTDLRINSHFLFNTMNQMASMALEAGVLPLYQSILDLSRLFQYPLRNKEAEVSLQSEFEYLQSYLKLQKLRYGEHLKITNDITVDMMRWKVPFNFLMPVAENAFTHGFGNEEEKFLSVSIHKAVDKILIKIENSGVSLDSLTVRSVMLGLKSDTSHGLSMVNKKLSLLYGNQFVLEFDSIPEGGAVVRIGIPAVPTED